MLNRQTVLLLFKYPGQIIRFETKIGYSSFEQFIYWIDVMGARTVEKYISFDKYLKDIQKKRDILLEK